MTSVGVVLIDKWDKSQYCSLNDFYMFLEFDNFIAPLPFHEFLNAIILRDHEVYSESYCDTLNIFNVTGTSDASNFNRIAVLGRILHAKNSKTNVGTGYVLIEEVINDCHSVEAASSSDKGAAKGGEQNYSLAGFSFALNTSRVFRIVLAASAISAVLIGGLAELASVTHRDQGMEGMMKSFSPWRSCCSMLSRPLCFRSRPSFFETISSPLDNSAWFGGEYDFP